MPGVKKCVNSEQGKYLIADSAAYHFNDNLKKVLTSDGDFKIMDIDQQYALLGKRAFKIDGTEVVENHLVTLNGLEKSHTQTKLSVNSFLEHLKVLDDDSLLLASATNFFIYKLKTSAFIPLVQANSSDSQVKADACSVLVTTRSEAQ